MQIRICSGVDGCSRFLEASVSYVAGGLSSARPITSTIAMNYSDRCRPLVAIQGEHLLKSHWTVCHRGRILRSHEPEMCLADCEIPAIHHT
jgi:hypothetical protein